MNKKIAVVVGILGIVVAVVLAIRFAFVNVSGGSMYPVFLHGDILLVDRFGQGKTNPERGDLVVFDSPTIKGAEFIARVVGLPGEEIRIDDGVVYIDNEKLFEEYLVSEKRTSVNAERYTQVKLSSGQYFLMGDNRPRSTDSRRFGPVTEEMIKAKITAVVWRKI